MRTHKQISLVIAAVISASVSSGCSGGRDMDKLNRAIALEIIQDSVRQNKIQLPDMAIVISYPHEVGAPKVDSRPVWMNDSQFKFDSQQARERMEILKSMESAGWIAEGACAFQSYDTVLTQGRAWSCFYPKRPDIGLRAGTWQGEALLQLPVSKYDRMEITGIVQGADGRSAQVEALLHAAPTDLYIASKNVEVPVGWPGPAAVNRQMPYHFMFVKYDDGWRVQH